MAHRDPQENDLDAGEYVLGTLEGPERKAFEVQMARDVETLGAVRWWEQRLAGLGLRLKPVAPRPLVWLGIAHRMMTAAPVHPAAAAGAGTGLRVWAALATAASLVLGFGLYREMSRPAPEPLLVTQQVEVPVLAKTFVAVLQMPDSDLQWTVSVTPDRSAIAVRAAGAVPEAVAAGDAELWLITDVGPISLGVLPKSGELRSTLKGQPHFESGRTVAVSLEPAGGSPTGQPTGPVVSTAQVLLAS